MTNLSIQKKYEVEYARQGKDHNFEKIPDIIDHLTYITKKEVEDENGNTNEKFYRKRLTVYAKELYRIIKKSAGKTICWKNTDHLAYEVNCSEGSITNAKKELSQTFEQLDGLSLIDIIESRVNRYDATGKKNGTKPKHSISIVNIWKNNNAYMHIAYKVEKLPLGEISQKEAEIAIERMYQNFKEKVVHNSEADSPHEPGPSAGSPHEPPPREADSPHERKHTPTSYTYVKEAYPLDSKPSPSQICLLSNENVEKFTKTHSLVFDWLSRFGFNPTMVERMGKYPLSSLIANIHYCAKMVRKKCPDNINAYFWSSLENEYYLKSF